MNVIGSPTTLSERTVQPDVRHLDRLIETVTADIARRQAEDGHWAFELEADATIPAEYILLNHYLGTIDDALEAKLANYLRRVQGVHGGWPLYHDGDFNMSASTKAYYALKLVGDDPDAVHMVRARKAILEHGGAAKSNVFTRFALALFGQVPWRAVPVMRVEAMLLPKWAPFHVDKVSYWSRTVMVPLLVLASRKAKAKNPRGVGVRELFVVPPEEERHYKVNATGSLLGGLMLAVDRIAQVAEPLFPKFMERKAPDRAMDFVRKRLNGEDGLGGIFPAMANTIMAFDLMGMPRDHSDYVTACRAIDKLLIVKDDEAYCQPCVSPVWDTGLSSLALIEAGIKGSNSPVGRAADWLKGRQILDLVGDWAVNRPNVRPGGWAFQYRNDYYPDVDDTAVVAIGLHRADPEKYWESVRRAAEWVVGMQGKRGGWGAFDADNEFYFLENIPFADHGALLDPPTADVSARCIGMLAQLGAKPDWPEMARAIAYMREIQEKDGSWFGRWGVNYIYGTWSALAALNAAGLAPNDPTMAKAADWLIAIQNEDGGWDEDCASYRLDYKGYEPAPSIASQTAWALLGLMAAGRVDDVAVARGIDYLRKTQAPDGLWTQDHYTGGGFPRVFYLRYHGYPKFFPLWALARYRNLKAGNSRRVAHGL